LGTSLTYLFTRSYRLAYRHYLLSLSRFVKPMDERANLLGESIKRARGRIAEARKPKKAEVK
jgi:hypothetical protein